MTLVNRHKHHSTCMVVRGQLCRVSFVLASICGCWGSNLGPGLDCWAASILTHRSISLAPSSLEVTEMIALKPSTDLHSVFPHTIYLINFYLANEHSPMWFLFSASQCCSMESELDQKPEGLEDRHWEQHLD